MQAVIFHLATTPFIQTQVLAAFEKAARDNGSSASWSGTAWFCYDSTPPWYAAPDTKLELMAELGGVAT